MIKTTLYALLMLWTLVGTGQVVINEFDSDTPSTDEMEFIELKSTTANFPLDGYVLVLFNGSTSASVNSRSYYTIDLDGYQTDVNGLILIGNEAVSPVPNQLFPTNIIQNGADAIALYAGSASDFPDQTLATTTNLIDAVAYDTNDADAVTLMDLLGLTVQVDEDENSQMTTQSIQRKSDGTYEVKTPTPGANNDGTGVQPNGILITASTTTPNEGDSFSITFTTQTNVTSDLSFVFTLTDAEFTSADFTGNLNVLIPAGGNTYSTTITLVDDAINEGDELARIRFGTIPNGFIKLNDNVEIRVLDNDFTVAAWGTPLNPTYGMVANETPAGYYATLEGKSGAVLKQAIQDIVANPAVVRAQNYGDITDILMVADQNPLNSNQVWLMYVEQGRAKFSFQNTSSNIGSWNREHIFPQSRGGFANGTDSTADGIAVYSATNADDIDAGHADAHHIRAEDGPENSLRSNRDYGTDYNGPASNQGSWHGDVARSVFYMAVRYNGLSVVNGDPIDTTMGQLGDLQTMLTWNQTDPADDFEMNRNNVIYDWQMNRNPFIDYPELADYIWGANAGQPWFASLSNNDFAGMDIQIYPNPARSSVSVSGLEGAATATLYSITGAKVMESQISQDAPLQFNLESGMYFLRITSENQSIMKKLIIK